MTLHYIMLRDTTLHYNTLQRLNLVHDKKMNQMQVRGVPARKYEADDASPSTYAVPGDLYCCPEGICICCNPSSCSTYTAGSQVELIHAKMAIHVA